MTFNIYKGEIIGILGHNGSGKTLLLDLITGITKKTNGKIYINNIDIDSNINKIRE